MRNDSKIMIVDDDQRNVKLLKAILQAEGYRCMEALSGPEALRLVREGPPDLVLLDIMMPQMDGYEVLRRLRSAPQTEHIPVVMVTALTEREDRVRALDLGADDFISKPIDRVELLARIRSLLRIKRFHDELKAKLHQIQQQNEHIRRLMTERKALVDMIVHDLKTPIAGLQGYLELILLARERLDDRTVQYIEKSLHCCTELDLMVTNILALEKAEDKPLRINRQPLQPQGLVSEALSVYEFKIKKKDITVQTENHCSRSIIADGQILKRVIYNLLDNAIKHTRPKGRISITIQCEEDRREFLFSIKNEGSIIPIEDKERLFQMFQQAGNASFIGSWGIGLAFCKMAVEAHGGRIWVESSEKDHSCTFSFAIPQDGGTF